MRSRWPKLVHDQLLAGLVWKPDVKVCRMCSVRGPPIIPPFHLDIVDKKAAERAAAAEKRAAAAAVKKSAPWAMSSFGSVFGASSTTAAAPPAAPPPRLQWQQPMLPAPAPPRPTPSLPPQAAVPSSVTSTSAPQPFQMGSGSGASTNTAGSWQQLSLMGSGRPPSSLQPPCAAPSQWHQSVPPPSLPPSLQPLHAAPLQLRWHTTHVPPPLPSVDLTHECSPERKKIRQSNAAPVRQSNSAPLLLSPPRAASSAAASSVHMDAPTRNTWQSVDRVLSSNRDRINSCAFLTPASRAAMAAHGWQAAHFAAAGQLILELLELLHTPAGVQVAARFAVELRSIADLPLVLEGLHETLDERERQRKYAAASGVISFPMRREGDERTVHICGSPRDDCAAHTAKIKASNVKHCYGGDGERQCRSRSAAAIQEAYQFVLARTRALDAVLVKHATGHELLAAHDDEVLLYIGIKIAMSLPMHDRRTWQRLPASVRSDLASVNGVGGGSWQSPGRERAWLDDGESWQDTKHSPHPLPWPRNCADAHPLCYGRFRASRHCLLRVEWGAPQAQGRGGARLRVLLRHDPWPRRASKGAPPTE